MIAIDGPAGAGKGTVARRAGRAPRLPAARHRRDVSARWRGRVARAGLAADDTPALATPSSQRVRDRHWRAIGWSSTGATSPTTSARRRSANADLAALDAGRRCASTLTPLQRRLAAAGGVVLEGATPGTVSVSPDADVKFYLDASLAGARPSAAGRADAQARDRSAPEAAVRGEIVRRDRQDSSPRAGAAAPRPPDAVEGGHDWTSSVDQVVGVMLSRRGRAAAANLG